MCERRRDPFDTDAAGLLGDGRGAGRHLLRRGRRLRGARGPGRRVGRGLRPGRPGRPPRRRRPGRSQRRVADARPLRAPAAGPGGRCRSTRPTARDRSPTSPRCATSAPPAPNGWSTSTARGCWGRSPPIPERCLRLAARSQRRRRRRRRPSPGTPAAPSATSTSSSPRTGWRTWRRRSTPASASARWRSCTRTPTG